MDEQEAREWVEAKFDVPRETMDRIDAFVELLRDENQRQNLISRNSADLIWSRHIADSAQLVPHSHHPSSEWLDLGTGAGFPGLVASLLHPAPVTLIESRKLRVDFLQRASEVLGVTPIIICDKAERVEESKFGIISARAFAPLERLFALAERFATRETRWVLPRGRNAKSELEAAESSWQGEFRLEPSLTDAEARIIVAQGVRRRGKGKKTR